VAISEMTEDLVFKGLYLWGFLPFWAKTLLKIKLVESTRSLIFPQAAFKLQLPEAFSCLNLDIWSAYSFLFEQVSMRRLTLTEAAFRLKVPMELSRLHYFRHSVGIWLSFVTSKCEKFDLYRSFKLKVPGYFYCLHVHLDICIWLTLHGSEHEKLGLYKSCCTLKEPEVNFLLKI